MLLWSDVTKKNTYYKLHLGMTMRSLPFLLLACLALLFMTGEADAKEPVWTYTPGIPYNPSSLSAAISGDGEYVVVSVGTRSGNNSYGVAFLFRNNTLLWNHTEGDTAKNPLISENGDYVVVHHAKSQCEMDCPPYFSVFRSENGTPLWQMEWNVSEIDTYDDTEGWRAVDITADGEYILVTSQLASAKGLHLLRIGNSTPIRNYTIDVNREKSFAISADGEYIVVAGMVSDESPDENVEGKISFFSKENSTPLWEYIFKPRWTGGNRFDSHISISEDGAFIAMAKECSYCGGASKIYLFNKESNATVWEYTPTDGGTFFNSIAMSSDGQYITAGASDGKIYLFHRDSNIPIWIYDIEGSLLRVVVSQAVISNDGKYIASFNYGYVFMLERENKTLLWDYNIGEYIEHIDMSADGMYIVVSTQDTVYLFENNIDDGGSSAEEAVCQHGDTKLADDGFNHCICNNGEWLCTDMEYEEKDGDSNVTVTPAAKDEGGIPAPSVIASVAAVAVIALRRRY